MTAANVVESRSLTERAMEVLRRSGNPFRNYFARNPDDEVCARYHVPELFASERDLLLSVVDLYRYDPMTHSEIVPVLGNKGAGKTHLLHSIKHGGDGAWQLLVTPGVYQKDTEFLEYLLFQIIDTLLGGGRQKGVRPLEYIADQLVRRLLGFALRDLSAEQRIELFPPPGLGRWAKRLGLGQNQAQERVEWLCETLSGYGNFARPPMPILSALNEAGISVEQTLELLASYIDRTEAQNTAGLMRRAIYQGFAKAALQKDEGSLANFLTYGFAELHFQVRPTRQDLVLALFKVIMEVFRSLKTPVVVAFDQLEDLLLARRSDDAHRIAEAFFAGIVQVMHQIDGLCFLIFAERGLWNRFVPSLDGYIQDRLNNPVHVPRHGTVKALRLEAPAPELARRVVEARLRPALEELPDFQELGEIFPFNDEQILRIARTEPTLRDMLQQFRHLFDHLIYGSENGESKPAPAPARPVADPEPVVTAVVPVVASVTTPSAIVQEPVATAMSVEPSAGEESAESDIISEPSNETEPVAEVAASRLEASFAAIEAEPKNRLPVEVPPALPAVKSVVVVETPPAREIVKSHITPAQMIEMWQQEQRAARRKLEPEGAMTGATRELQAGLGAFLQACHEHGVKAGPWRLQHVVGEWNFGEHPTYGAITIAHWACKDGQPWKVGIGLFLARGAGKPRDLEVKLSVMESEPAVIDHLILLRPEDDLALTGKSKTLWQDAERRGRHARIEAVSLDTFAMLSSFPRWLTAMTESQPDGQPLPNLADLIQEHCETLLEQVCMPIQQ